MRKKQILIVDDDENNIFSLSAVLKSEGFDVVTAKNGAECIEKLESVSTIHLVLLDMMMPVMNGFETLGIIRKNEKLKSLPIITLTAQAMKGYREECIQAGANDYCSKPVDIESLLLKINILLG
jgi:CheY-like chemotaxis protein